MIFVIANEVGELTSWADDILAAVEKLAISVFNGHHFLTVESHACGLKLLKAGDALFGKVTKSVLKAAHSNFSFHGGILNSEFGKKRVLVGPGSDFVKMTERFDRVLSLEDLLTMSLDPATIIAENLVDAQIYSKAAEHYLVAKRIKGVSSRCVVRGGGGSTIGPELEEISKEGRQFCLAITDSDKSWPGKGLSSTSGFCLKVSESNPVKIGFYNLMVREVENLVPPAVLRDFSSEKSYQIAVDGYERLLGVKACVREYGDVKDGVSGSFVFMLRAESEERKYLNDTWRRFNAGARCIEEVECLKAEGCACAAIPKIGAIGGLFNSWLREQTPHKVLERMKSPWLEAWLSVGEAGLAWSCASPRRRA